MRPKNLASATGFNPNQADFFIRDEFVTRYAIKAAMPVVIWCKLQVDLLLLKEEPVHSKPLSLS